MLLESLKDAYLSIMLDVLSFIVDCWVPDFDAATLASKFIDGSQVSPDLVTEALALYDDVLEQVTECETFERAENLLHRLAFASIMYNLPGESTSHNQLFSRRHSSGALSQDGIVLKGHIPRTHHTPHISVPSSHQTLDPHDT